MSDTLFSLACAMLAFIGSHFALSSLPIRTILQEKFGRSGFQLLYTIVAGGGLVWVGMTYGEARYDRAPFWDVTPGLMMVPIFVMPFACILLVSAVTSKNPTALGGERYAKDLKPVGGIMTVTRHPMLVAVSLWALSHITVNGDLPSLILFGGLLILCIGGMLHIDHRRSVTLGSDWGPIALTTSIIPFLAALQGRAKVDWSGIGLWRVAIGLGIYAVLIFAHPWLAGVAILPH